VPIVNTDVLAVIPARGGSKAVPHKNLRRVGGRPLIGWTIDAARAATSLSRVVVSTDSDDIAAVAIAEGAEVPTRRPASLAADDTAGVEPVLHMVEWLRDHQRYEPDVVVVLQPTSPLRKAGDFVAAVP